MAQQDDGAQQGMHGQVGSGTATRPDTLWLLPHLVRQASGVLARMVVYAQQLQALPRRVRRWVQRTLALSLLELALLLALGPGLGQAATIAVDGTTCTLVDAITAANTDAVAGGCTAGSGADTLVLTAGSTHTLMNSDNTTFGATGLPVVTSTITIQGNGSTVQRNSGAPAFRLLAVDTTGNLTVQQLTLQGGLASGYYSYENRGGGVYNQGTLTLSQCTLTGNSAASSGGGLYNRFGATALLSQCTVSGNSASSGGGGGALNRGTLTMSQCTVSGNSTGSPGGGLRSESSSTVTLSQCTMSGNSASLGGGVLIGTSSSVTLNQSILSGNSANSGGGIFNSYGFSTLSQSTVTGNSAASKGGGVYVRTNSSSGSSTLRQTLISGNTASSGAEFYSKGGPRIYVNAYNLFGHDGTSGLSNVSAGTSDVVPSGALSTLLNPTLAFNGGPTQTHALVSGSPAVDVVPAASCPTTDQRGYLRPGTGSTACDIGAYELNADLPSVVNSVVSFAAQSSTFRTSTTVPAGCPSGTVGTFNFQALLTVTGSNALEALKAEITTLTQGNTLLLADGGLGGAGDKYTLAQVEDFSDGTLTPTQTLTVPFTLCLHNFNAFQFVVDVRGHEL